MDSCAFFFAFGGLLKKMQEQGGLDEEVDPEVQSGRWIMAHGRIINNYWKHVKINTWPRKTENILKNNVINESKIPKIQYNIKQAVCVNWT